MANIIETLYRDFIFPYKRIMLILFLIILFIIASVYAYKWYAKPIIEQPLYDDVANANRRQKPVDVLLFTTEWCPYCVKAKPAWAEFKKKYDKKLINDHMINCIQIDCTDNETNAEVQAQIQKYEIEHYPTVKMLIDDKIIDFEASVSASNLDKFVNTIVNQA